MAKYLYILKHIYNVDKFNFCEKTYYFSSCAELNNWIEENRHLFSTNDLATLNIKELDTQADYGTQTINFSTYSDSHKEDCSLDYHEDSYEETDDYHDIWEEIYSYEESPVKDLSREEEINSSLDAGFLLLEKEKALKEELDKLELDADYYTQKYLKYNNTNTEP